MRWIQHQWSMLQDEREITKVNGELVTYFLSTLILPEIKRPDLFTTWSGSIKRAIEEEINLPLTSHVSLCIKRWASEQARKVASGKLYEPDQAVAIEPKNLQKLITLLWFRKWKNLSFKQSALAAYMCAHTGARCNEIVNLHIEDIEWKQDAEYTFLRLPLRVSKSNTFKTRREALVLPVPPASESPFRHWFKVIVKERKQGKMFLNTNTAKVRSHYKIAAKALNWEVSPTCHSLRAHFCVQALKAGASEADIITCCRWKDGQMLNTYRLRQIECTTAGPAFRVFQSKLNAGVNIQLATNPNQIPETPPTVSKIEVVDISDEEENLQAPPAKKQLVQSQITFQKRLVSTATQTDQVQFKETAVVPTLSPKAYEEWDKFLKKRK
jgi:integrase